MGVLSPPRDNRRQEKRNTMFAGSYRRFRYGAKPWQKTMKQTSKTLGGWVTVTNDTTLQNLTHYFEEWLPYRQISDFISNARRGKIDQRRRPKRQRPNTVTDKYILVLVWHIDNAALLWPLQPHRFAVYMSEISMSAHQQGKRSCIPEFINLDI